MIAQIDEEHAAMVADTVAPAGETDGLPDIGRAERPAGMGTVTVHGGLLLREGRHHSREAPQVKRGPRAAAQKAPSAQPADLPGSTVNPHMMCMSHNAFSHPVGHPEPPFEASPSAWRTLPLDGHFDLVYEDATGAWSNRSLEARELKLGPGRTLLGGIDARRGGYRGFRVDRIRRLTDGATGERIETGILDRLLGRAEAQRRADALRIRRQTRARRRAVLVGPA
jgi:hypothetical protein